MGLYRRNLGDEEGTLIYKTHRPISFHRSNEEVRSGMDECTLYILLGFLFGIVVGVVIEKLKVYVWISVRRYR